MRNLILFDNDSRDDLLPLTYTRPTCELRVGIWTIREKWEHWLHGEASYITQEYLSEKYPIQIADDNYVINGNTLPNPQLVRLIEQLELNEALMNGEELIAVRLTRAQFQHLMENEELEELIGYQLTETPLHQIQSLPDIYLQNGAQIVTDCTRLSHSSNSQDLSHVIVQGKEQIYIEEGAAIGVGTIINALEGPVYIGKNSRIMEGCMIRGPFALCEAGVLKMGAKIYSGTTIGPYSKVGGEVNNCVFVGYSNKGHDGFLGNSVIGEWCNFGADTNNSNLKNNYAEVKLWHYPSKQFRATGQQFCGLIMGDHSKCGINTMFNTGTVVGVHCNIFGEGFPRNFIPSYSWGGKQGFSTYKLEKALETADRMMERRDRKILEVDRRIYEHLFQESSSFRTWERSDG